MSTTFDLKEIENKVIENLKKVYDPEIPSNIFDLGLIYNIEHLHKTFFLVQFDKFLDQNQVTCTGNRQPFGYPFNNTKKDGF